MSEKLAPTAILTVFFTVRLPEKDQQG